jgi:Putative adhesin
MTGMNGTITSETPPTGKGSGRAPALPLTRARRVALMIGVPLCLVFTGYTGLSLVADVGQGHFPVNYAFPAGTGEANVSVSGGDITVRQAAATAARLTGTATYSLVRPDLKIRHIPGGVAVGYRCMVPAGNCGLDATLSVPARMTASVSTGGGDATAVGTTGNVTLSTGGGDVTADRVSGVLSLSTGGGNIHGTAITSARVTAHSGGGDVEIVFTQVPRDVHVDTGGGNVTIIVPPGSAQYHVTASTGGGNVTESVPINTSSPNVITATSGGGDVTIRQAA